MYQKYVQYELLRNEYRCIQKNILDFHTMYHTKSLLTFESIRPKFSHNTIDFAITGKTLLGFKAENS